MHGKHLQIKLTKANKTVSSLVSLPEMKKMIWVKPIKADVNKNKLN